jgi:hypothetical protein
MRAPNIKFHENPPSGIRADTCGQTEGREEAYKLFKRLTKRALKPISV